MPAPTTQMSARIFSSTAGRLGGRLVAVQTVRDSPECPSINCSFGRSLGHADARPRLAVMAQCFEIRNQIVQFLITDMVGGKCRHGSKPFPDLKSNGGAGQCLAVE